MNFWATIINFTLIFAVLLSLIFGYALIESKEQEKRDIQWKTYLWDCKTHDLNPKNFEDHFQMHYHAFSESNQKQLKDEIISILNSHPDAKLFHYNTPEKKWQQLGGRMGYAIALGSKIIWEQKLRQS